MRSLGYNKKQHRFKRNQEILVIAYSLHFSGRTDEDKQSLNLDGDTCYERHVETRRESTKHKLNMDIREGPKRRLPDEDFKGRLEEIWSQLFRKTIASRKPEIGMY